MWTEFLSSHAPRTPLFAYHEDEELCYGGFSWRLVHCTINRPLALDGAQRHKPQQLTGSFTDLRWDPPYQVCRIFGTVVKTQVRLSHCSLSHTC